MGFVNSFFLTREWFIKYFYTSHIRSNITKTTTSLKYIIIIIATANTIAIITRDMPFMTADICLLSFSCLCCYRWSCCIPQYRVVNKEGSLLWRVKGGTCHYRCCSQIHFEVFVKIYNLLYFVCVCHQVFCKIIQYFDFTFYLCLHL